VNLASTQSWIQFWIDFILHGGVISLAGWSSLLLLAAMAVWAVMRHRRVPTASACFYALAHVQFIFFVWAMPMHGIIYTCSAISAFHGFSLFGFWMGTILLSLGVELMSVLILLGFVALATRTKPRCEARSAAGISIVVTDIVVLVGSLVVLMAAR